MKATTSYDNGKLVYHSGGQFLSDRKQQAGSRNTYDNFTEGKPSESVELWHTLTELNDTVTHIACSGNLEQANQVRDLLVQVKREIYNLLAEQ